VDDVEMFKIIDIPAEKVLATPMGELLSQLSVDFFPFFQ
jgi:hypothetical protein